MTNGPSSTVLFCVVLGSFISFSEANVDYEEDVLSPGLKIATVTSGRTWVHIRSDSSSSLVSVWIEPVLEKKWS